MVFSSYAKQRIVFLSATHKSPTIAKILHKEGIKASRRGVLKFIRRYQRSGTIQRLPGSGRISKITEEIKAIVEEQMRADDETTAVQLHKLLNDRGYAISALFFAAGSPLDGRFEAVHIASLSEE